MRKRTMIWMLFTILLLALTGCGKEETGETGKSYQVYYLNEKNTKISSLEYQTETGETLALVGELLEKMREKPEKGAYETVIGNGYDIVNYFLVEQTLTINMDERYRELNPIKSILVRAALVRTLTQIDGIQVISMTINGDALLDASGNVVGPMKADLFIDNAGDEINAVETVKLTLYFATEDGKALKKVNRTLDYNSNISMEKLVVEQLIAGPLEDGGNPTINPATKVINVTTKDGICYVNLDDAFLSQLFEVSPEVTLYSITNSLGELANINKVQFSINGETNILYREKMDLNVMYERNLDLISEE